MLAISSAAALSTHQVCSQPRIPGATAPVPCRGPCTPQLCSPTPPPLPGQAECPSLFPRTLSLQQPLLEGTASTQRVPPPPLPPATAPHCPPPARVPAPPGR